MVHKPEHRVRRHTKPDHQPMLPTAFIRSGSLDTTIREARYRFDEVNPDRKNKWR